MSTAINAPSPALEAAATNAGLILTAAEPGTDFAGTPTTRAVLSLAADPSRQQVLELSQAFDASNPKFAAELAVYLREAAHRLRNPRPDVYLTLHGLPLSFGQFAWPFHGSTSGADTFIVHGNIHLEDGNATGLHAKISASLTQTFATVVLALEQPFAEGFIYNAVRKTLDQGQLELVKSGNRQPVPVTTRYYSMKQQVFIFNDTTEQQRRAYLAAKAFWLSHVLGGGAPVWLTDPRDAQYLNTNVADLKTTVGALAKDGLVLLDESGEWGAATDTLRNQEEAYRAQVAEALAFLKPTFNEQMRGGHANM
ncbi:MAG: hypothetical protein HIU91_01115 [Acidobacteria bacterium]|nr:hypothetical protein [Acidobacteriota bacterium]